MSKDLAKEFVDKQVAIVTSSAEKIATCHKAQDSIKKMLNYLDAAIECVKDVKTDEELAQAAYLVHHIEEAKKIGDTLSKIYTDIVVLLSFNPDIESNVKVVSTLESVASDLIKSLVAKHSVILTELRIQRN